MCYTAGMKQRTEQLSIRVTPRERQALESAAKSLGFKEVGAYLRAAAFTGGTPAEYTYTVVIHPADPDEGGFWAEVPSLPGCNSQGRTYEETVDNTRQAITGYLRMLLRTGETIPVEKQPRSKTITAVRVAV
jgi:predicted RNase H-like HicB family nuclease